MPEALYSPWSLIPKFIGDKAAILFWFRIDKEIPMAYISPLISDYTSLSDTEKDMAAEMVMGLLEEQEMNALREYLNSKGIKMMPGTIRLPAWGYRVLDDNRVPIRPWSMQEEGEGTGFYRLADEPDYSLDFKIHGFYKVTPDLYNAAHKKLTDCPVGIE